LNAAEEKSYESLIHVVGSNEVGRTVCRFFVAFCGGLAKVLNDFNSHYNTNHWRAKAMNSFKNVVERIKALDSERRNLLLEIEELKKMADSKAKALENEVGMLREEVKSLRVLLSSDQPEPEFEPKKKQFKK